jgi:hypothetical protein
VKIGCVVLAVLALLLLVLVGGAGGWWYWTGTPTYSVKQIEAALRDRDVESFQAHVDLDALLGDAFDQLAAAEGAKDGWGEFGRMLGAAIFKPILVSKLKREVLADVAAGRPPASATISARPSVAGIERVTRRGALADVGLRVQDGARSYVVELRLRQAGRRWRAISISNLPALVDEYRRPRP